jgi:membrane protease YdiL (CAAX protease family)
VKNLYKFSSTLEVMYLFPVSFSFEKKSVFYLNFFLILLIILTFLFDISISYFFYINIIVTFFISYYFFKRSKKLSKTLILTNLFIFFYFLYPKVSEFLVLLFGRDSYLFISLYSLILAYVFIAFSGNLQSFLSTISNFSFKIFSIISLVGFVFGMLFFYVKEPIPFYMITSLSSFDLSVIFLSFIVPSFLIAISEQFIFTGFLFHSYKQLTSQKEAMYQTAILFVSFHLLRFEILVKHYFKYFNETYLFFLISYYLLLFIFMLLSLYWYSFKSKHYKGCFVYPIWFHFIVDFSLFIFYALWIS